MKKEQFKEITLTIPAHVQEALWWTSYGEGDKYTLILIYLLKLASKVN